MKTKISFLAMAFLLLTTFASAQSADTVGPSCRAKKQILLPLHKFEQNPLTSWCWAATAQNVMAFHDKEIEQCTVVANVYKNKYADEKPCCGGIATECWGESGYPEWALTKFQFSFLHTWNTERSKKNLTWEEATEEICQNRPFISSLDLTYGDRHSVVVTGYSVEHGVRVYDPLANDTIFQSSVDFFDGQSPLYTRVRDTYNIQPSR